jgi:hypothetical protein
MVRAAALVLISLLMANVSQAQNRASDDGAMSAGESANTAAKSEQSNDYIMGGSSIATGGALMTKNCPPCFSPKPSPYNCMMCAAGAGGIAAGVKNIFQGSGRQSSIDPTNGINRNAGSGFNNDFNAENYNDDGIGMGGQGNDPLPPAVAEVLQEGKDIAKQYGLDVTNPASLEAFNAKTASKGGGGGDDGGSPGALSALSPEMQAAVDKARAKFLNKFGVGSVGFEGGGGGKAMAATGGGDNLDLSGLLDSMKGSRGPASVEGLQKTLGGDPIGVAGDDIFKQVTRRYQNKIQSKTFLPPPNSPLRRK